MPLPVSQKTGISLVFIAKVGKNYATLALNTAGESIACARNLKRYAISVPPRHLQPPWDDSAAEQTRQIRRDISRYVVPPDAAVFPFLKKSGKVEKWKRGRVLRLFPFPPRHSTFPLFTLLVHRCVTIAYIGVNRRDRHLCIGTRPRNERGTSAAFCDHERSECRVHTSAGQQATPKDPLRAVRTEADGERIRRGNSSANPSPKVIHGR